MTRKDGFKTLNMYEEILLDILLHGQTHKICSGVSKEKLLIIYITHKVFLPYGLIQHKGHNINRECNSSSQQIHVKTKLTNLSEGFILIAMLCLTLVASVSTRSPVEGLL